MPYGGGHDRAGGQMMATGGVCDGSGRKTRHYWGRRDEPVVTRLDRRFHWFQRLEEFRGRSSVYL